MFKDLEIFWEKIGLSVNLVIYFMFYWVIIGWYLVLDILNDVNGFNDFICGKFNIIIGKLILIVK